MTDTSSNVETKDPSRLTRGILKQTLIVVFVAFVLSLLVAGWVVLVAQMKADIASLTVFIEASVQLLGFSGIIFGVTYTEHRSAIGRLRRERTRWLTRLATYRGMTAKASGQILTDENGIRKVSDQLTEELWRTRMSYLSMLTGYFFAFIMMTIAVTSSIVHILILQSSPTILGTVLSGIELGTLILGIQMLIYAIFRGALLVTE